MAISSRHPEIERLANALGIPGNTREFSINIDFRDHSAVTLNITRYITKEEAKEITEILTEYNLVPKKKK